MLLQSRPAAQFVLQAACRKTSVQICSNCQHYSSGIPTNLLKVVARRTSGGIKRWSSSSSKSPVSGANDATTGSPKPEEKAKKGLQFLPRPLGVETPPRTTKISWDERKAKLLNYDEHLKERRHLMKELATKGYWTDMTRLDEYGGKMWIAAPALIKDSVSLYFPDVQGTTLDAKQTAHTTDLCHGKISIVAILTTLMSESHVQSFVNPILKDFESNLSFRFVQINLQENRLKSILVSMLMSRLKDNVPAKFQSTYMLSHQNMEYVREDLGLLNKHIGFVYLVDENVKIRWAGCGFAREEELASLSGCLRELLHRLEQNGKTKAVQEQK